MRLLRDFIILTLLLLVAPLRIRTRRHLSRLSQSIDVTFGPGARVVVHAVSLGEVNAAAQLVRELCEMGVHVVCSSTTSSGRQQSQELHPEADQVEWPLDITYCCNRWLDQVQPDVLVKGGDYDPEASKGERGFIVGSEAVRECGGRVEVIPLVPGRSTTNIIKKS